MFLSQNSAIFIRILQKLGADRVFVLLLFTGTLRYSAKHRNDYADGRPPASAVLLYFASVENQKRSDLFRLSEATRFAFNRNKREICTGTCIG
jgi:hypothetical protein